MSSFPWTVTAPEQAEVFYALERVAIHTHLRVIAGERTGIRQSEETITETNLLELSVMLPNQQPRDSTRSRPRCCRYSLTVLPTSRTAAAETIATYEIYREP